MTWLEGVRQKNFTPDTLGSDKSAKSHEDDRKNFEPYESGSDISAKSQRQPPSITFGTDEPIGREVFVEAHQRQSEAIIIAYQRSWFDYDLRDGTYPPAELQEAKLLVKRGSVLRYRLRWPGGTPQPRSESDAVGAPALEAK